jgi:hypothetical protein
LFNGSLAFTSAPLLIKNNTSLNFPDKEAIKGLIYKNNKCLIILIKIPFNSRILSSAMLLNGFVVKVEEDVVP